MDFKFRSTAIELMDDPQMDAEKYKAAYLDINRCNKLLGGYGITINAVLDLLSKAEKKSYTILDVGCGDGEMLRKLSKKLRNKGFDCQLVGIDLRDDVLGIAKDKSKFYPDISYEKQDVLTIDRHFECDLVLCTLTMHHFEDDQIDALLKKATEFAKIGIVINDLQRSKMAYWLFKFFSTVFIQTAIAKSDGLTSISKGFLKRELEAFSQKLTKVKHHIEWKWAFRYVWVMQTNQRN